MPTTTPDRLELMQTFVRIVEAGSLSAAALQMGATQPTVSRRLQALERSLGVRLLRRSTHAMALTEDGQRCYAGAKALLERWTAFETGLRGASEEPEGLLRVVVPHAFGQQQLVVPMADYLRRYPRVAVEWLLHDRMPDFVGGAIDCAVRVGEVSDPGVVAVKIAEVPRIAVAAPALLAGRDPAAWATPGAVAALPWLALQTYYRREITFVHRDGHEQSLAIAPRMSTDSLLALRSAALLGTGVGVVSAWLVQDDIAAGRLVHLLPDWHASPLPVYVIYPYAHFYPARLRRFVDLLREALPAGEGWVAGLAPPPLAMPPAPPLPPG